MPRVSSLTEEVQKKICLALRGGNYRKVAAAFAGIPRSTFNLWIERGKKAKLGDEKFVEFLEAIEIAEAESEVMLVAKVRNGGKEWLPAMTTLSRRWPDRWGQGRMEKLQRIKTRADMELTKAKTAALLEWDDVLAHATPEQRAELLAIAKRVKARFVGSADSASPSGSGQAH